MREFDPRRGVFRLTPTLLLCAAVAALLVGWNALHNGAAQAATLDAEAATNMQLDAFADAEVQLGFARPVQVPAQVQPGESLEAAVIRTGVGRDDARLAVETLADVMDIRAVKAGLVFEAAIASPLGRRGSARLMGLSMRAGPATAITLARTFDGALRLRTLDEPVREETAVASGVVEGSVYESAVRLGATSAVAIELVRLFAQRLDFERDIKAGDSLTLAFDRRVTDSGRTVEVGDLQFAELGGLRFYRFRRPDGEAGYFDEAGRNTRAFLLRTPVDGAHITSAFGQRRHPVLGYNRAHQGVDFAAGRGTPVIAAGDGVVQEARRWGGYGNWLRIAHAGGWDTGYGHLMRYAPGMVPGQPVRQGQVVGYVGSTGLSTGPHLHYEVWLNGERVNPMGAWAPVGTVLAGAELNAFRAQARRINALVEARPAPTLLAAASIRTAGLRR